MDQELAEVARMIGSGQSSTEPLEEILASIEQTLLKQGRDIAAEVGSLQQAAQAADQSLKENLHVQQGRLAAIDDKTGHVIAEFARALDGGLRIGERLAAAEAARQQVQFAEDLMAYIKFFEDCPRETTAAVLDCRREDLLTFLPPKLRKQSWMEISQVFLSLRRVLYDINGSEMEPREQASFVFLQELVIALSTAIEGVLLSMFESRMMAALEHPSSERLLSQTRELVDALMLFNEGAALQKRYIFSVVARRFVPADVTKKRGGLGSKLKEGLEGIGRTFKKAGQAVKRVSTKPSAERGGGGGGGNAASDDSSSAGDEFEGEGEDEHDHEGEGAPGASPQKISDMISFGRFGDAALQLEHGALQEEEAQGVFGSLLAKTFGRGRAHSGAGLGEDSSEIMDRMSRLFASLHGLFTEQIVVLRKVFPLLTAQKVIKMLLQRIFNDPAFGIQGRIDAVMRSGEQVSPSYYLDVLMIVREKLSAFFLMIMDCISYIGHSAVEEEGRRGAASKAHAETAFLLWSEEVHGFLEEQVYLMLQGYTKDYFEKELAFLKQQYCDTLRSATADDPTILSKTSPSEPLPRIRPEKVKTVAGLVGAVNTPLVHRILGVTAEAVSRMGSIGRDDAALPLRAKDVFLTMIGFIVDGILIPAGRAFKALLSKHAASRQFTAAAISTDYLLLISCLHNSFFRIKSKFESTFVPALMYENNELTVCREYHRKAMRALDVVSSECIHKWIETSALYNERLLANLQSRYDFAPRFDNKRNAGIEPTTACKQLCATLANNVAFVKRHISGDSVSSSPDRHNLEAVLWRELGRRLVASYLSHLRKSKISQDGAFVLVRDLDEYYSAVDSMGCAEVLDMFLSMREMAAVFMAAAESVEGMVTGELRHIDTHILLCLLRARSDFSMRAAWVKHLKQLYPSFNKWDAPFAWEVADGQNKAEGKQSGPPHTLRKVSVEKSALLMPVSRAYGGPGGGGPGGIPSDASGAATRAPPVKDGVYKMLRTAEQNASRPAAQPAAEPEPVFTPVKGPAPAPAPASAAKAAAPAGAKAKAAEPPRDAGSSKKPNMLERMTSKFEEIIDTPSGAQANAKSSGEKKKNIFGNVGKLFGKN